MGNQNDFESNEQEQYYLEQYRKQLEEQELLEQEYYYISYLEDKCKDNDRRIAELEQELFKLKEKEVMPKFKDGDEVWFIVDEKIEKGKVLENSPHEYSKFIYSITGGGIGYYSENYIFASKEEAHQKLKEIKRS